MFKNPYTSESTLNTINLQSNIRMICTNSNRSAEPIFVENEHSNLNSSLLTNSKSFSTLKELEIINQVKKWNIKFNETQDAIDFLESIEELAAMDNISLNDLIHVMHELLDDKSLKCLKSANNPCKEWNDFKNGFLNIFLTPSYFEKLEEDIRKFTQRPKEPFRNYALSLKNLMRQTKLNEVQKLERIFRNAQPEYQSYIINKDFTSFDELLTFTDNIESKQNVSMKRFIQSDAGAANSFQSNSFGKRIHELSMDFNNEEPSNKRISLNNTSLLYEESQIMATIMLENKLIKSPIDTSTQRNFVGSKFLKQLICKPTYVKDNFEVNSADGSMKRITMGVQLHVIFGNSSKKCTFFIMPGFKEDLKLGLEFLFTFNATISCAGLLLNCSLKNITQEPCKDNEKSEVKTLPQSDEFPLNQSIIEQNVPSNLPTGLYETDIPECLHDIISTALQRRIPGKKIKFLKHVNNILFSIIITRSGKPKFKIINKKQEEISE